MSINPRIAASATRYATWFTRLVIALTFGIVACEGQPRANEVWVEIAADPTPAVVAESLLAHNIVSDTAEFTRLAQFRRRYRDILPGLYALRPGTPMGRVLSILRHGPAPVAKVVVRERMTLAELVTGLAEATGIDAERFLSAARDSGLRARVGAHGPSIEGYLFPTTYYVDRTMNPLYILRQMADTFETRWHPEWNGRLDSLGITRDQVVTLASIVAGEMPLPEDIFHVASVYHNRLTRGMRLQADPTVVYALGERRRLNNQDYRVSSDYNTYAIRGLPPGPIGQPSTASLEATLYPAESQDLFFVGRNDGRHQFSRTYSEHLQTIAQVRGRKRPVTPALIKQAPPAQRSS